MKINWKAHRAGAFSVLVLGSVVGLAILGMFYGAVFNSWIADHAQALLIFLGIVVVVATYIIAYTKYEVDHPGEK